MIYTKQQPISQVMGLWAIPKTYVIPGEFPFTYELYGTTNHWRADAILIEQVEVHATVPGALDLFHKALDTLDEKAKKANEDYQNTLRAIAEERKKLLLLAAPTAEQPDIVGEATVIPNDVEDGELF